MPALREFAPDQLQDPRDTSSVHWLQSWFCSAHHSEGRLLLAALTVPRCAKNRVWRVRAADSAEDDAGHVVEADSSGAWWRSCFVRAGRLGSQAQAAAAAAALAGAGKPQVQISPVGHAPPPLPCSFLCAPVCSAKTSLVHR